MYSLCTKPEGNQCLGITQWFVILQEILSVKYLLLARDVLAQMLDYDGPSLPHYIFT